MTDFVIVVATLAAIAPTGMPAEAPDRIPTLGFHTYPSLEACEAAVSQNTARPGTRLVCLPVEQPPGGLTNAH